MSYTVPRCLGIFRKPVLCLKYVSNLSAKCFSGKVDMPADHFRTFDEMIKYRRGQAKRSALIGVNKETSIDEVLTICERYGKLTKKIVFEPGPASTHEFVCLVEYAYQNELRDLLASCEYSFNEGTIPVFSRMLSHSASKSGRSLVQLKTMGLVEHNLCLLSDSKNPKSSFSNSKHFEVLYKEQSLDDLGSRLRFLFCMQVEDSLSGLLPDCKILPFGSSVNGFGCRRCDLDAFLSIRPAQSVNTTEQTMTFHPSSRLIVNPRVRTQVTLDVLGDLLQNFFPCIGHVQKILRARVPILKMQHTMTGIECDISVSNGTGYHMSELLFLLGELDSRVRLLVFAVRHWAHINHLTRNNSGAWITNFSLTLMVIYFLQTRQPAVLPTVQQLKDLAGPKDQCIFDGVDCTFKRNFSEIQKTTNTEDISVLFCEFFRFCHLMNWKDEAISLVTGQVTEKSDNSAIFIQNPLEHSLNVSKNVSPKEADMFLTCVTTTLQEVEKDMLNSETFYLFNAPSVAKVSLHRFRGLDIRALFDKPSDVSSTPASDRVSFNRFKGLNMRVILNKPSELSATPPAGTFSADQQSPADGSHVNAVSQFDKSKEHTTVTHRQKFAVPVFDQVKNFNKDYKVKNSLQIPSSQRKRSKKGKQSNVKYLKPEYFLKF